MNQRMALGFLALVYLTVVGSRVWSQGLAAETPAALPAAGKSSADCELDALLTHWVLESIPHQFEDHRKWGQQQLKNTRLRWRIDPDGKWETYRENELVNHGEWSRFSVRLLDPSQTFEVQLENVRAGEGGEMEFDVHCTALLAISGRQAKWYKGVQMYSVGAEGSAQVRLVVSCALRTSLDLRQFPPDIVFTPRVTAANLTLLDFRLDHVGKFGGEIAQQIGRIARQVLEEKLTEREEKLVQQLNSKIAANQAKLRLNSQRAANFPWAQDVQPYLEPKVQQFLKEE